MIKSALIGCSLLFVSASALALSCDNPNTPYDRTYCAALQMVQDDQLLNEQYKKTMSTLNANQKKTVKTAQIQWLKQRDSECSSGSLVNLGCVNPKMSARIELLKSIERECRNAGCDEAKLSRVE